jgi:hypothetical protein
MRWTGCIARTERKRMHVGFWWGNQNERDHWEDIDVDERILLL